MPDLARDAERSPSEKIALRSQLLTARRSLPASVRASAAVSVQASILALVRRAQPTVCAAYVPVGSEPGGPDLPSVLAPLTRLLLPRLLPDHALDWAIYDGTLVDGPRGLREPAGPPADVRDASLLIVPALAVSRSGVRLGRGGGSYDRALAGASSALTVALLHDGELLDFVPSEPHDRAVHAVITPADGLVVLSEPPGGRNKLR
jgi:5-formyltetrahydrofolate cyclo-ligase